MPKTELPHGYLDAFKSRGFLLVERIGSGLSGTVFRATQLSLDRDVAIKVFDNTISAKDGKLRKRFEHEARLLARVRHPSVPVVLTRGEVKVGGKDLPFTAMEFIAGLDLQQIIETERHLELVRAVGYTCQVLAALGAAHAKRIIHRDVKPGNIMVDPTTGHVHLIDFSIGVSLAGEPGLTRVTTGSAQPGTWDYMAPEQRAGRDVDHRVDIYSCGIVLFELLSGHNRVRLDSVDADLSHVPAGVRAIISGACQEDRARRYDSAETFRRELAPFGTGIRAREQPADALCLNLKCPGARWTSRRYYEGPRVVQHSTENVCEHCGSNLSYPCEKCGRAFTGHPFCGNCGRQHYDVPECKQCGSWLMEEDMGTDTAAKGCQKCRSKRQRSEATVPAAPPDDFGFDGPGDDTPF